MDPKLQAIMDKTGRENRAAEAKVECSLEQAIALASFLHGWSKGKPIVRQDADSTFWAAGKWMTKIAWPQAEAMRKAGLVNLSGDPKARGCTITFKRA
jgi:hypothetical protein